MRPRATKSRRVSAPGDGKGNLKRQSVLLPPYFVERQHGVRFKAHDLRSFDTNLELKAVASAVLLIAVNTPSAWRGLLVADARLRQPRGHGIDANLRTLSLAFGEAFPAARIAIPRWRRRPHRNSEDARIQRSQACGSGNLPIRRQCHALRLRRCVPAVRSTDDEREKENGDRAVGTQLAADHRASRTATPRRSYKVRRSCSGIGSTRPINRFSMPQAR